MKKYYIVIAGFVLSSCFLFEPEKGVILYDNYCLSNIDVYNKNKLLFSLKKEESKYRNFFVEQSIDLTNMFFVEKGVKKNFYVERVNRNRYNIIACPENVNPTDDGNWIRAK